MYNNDLLKANSPEGTDFLKINTPLGKFKPSPAMRVRFSDGKVLQLNRKTRRQLGLYGDRVKKVRPNAKAF